MDIEKLRELVQLMVDNELSEVVIRDGENRVAIKRGPLGAVQITPVAPVAPLAPTAPAETPAPAPPAKSPDEDLATIISPMVGTFYAAPSPDSDAYVSVGDEVDVNAVVCIVEAMKVMNEIKAEVRGQIARILVNNGEAVEYGQPMFLVKPS